MDGIIIVNKPQGWTSFDVCAKIRNLSQTKKVGHSGTLDPMATGVLPVFLGSATKSIQYFMSGDKGYLAEMTLGVRTDTLDAEGKILMSNAECRMPNEGEIKEILKKYLGKQKQKPPMYSAKKINGQPLYKLARKGIEIERPDKDIEIYSLELVNIDGAKVTFNVKCSKGTYVRQLASDMGDDLGCGAHLSKLVRTFAQPFLLSQALTMETIITLAKVGKLATIILKAEDILNGATTG